MEKGSFIKDVIIIHISDLHFSGYLQNLKGEGELSKIAKPQNFIRILDLESHLSTLIKKHNENMAFIVSGDLTTAAEPPAFETVAGYLMGKYRVSEHTQVGLSLIDTYRMGDRLMIVPGNHDRWHKINILSRWKNYDRKELFNKYFYNSSKIGFRAKIIGGISFLFLLLNSNNLSGKNYFNLKNAIGRGEVGDSQIASIKADYLQLKNDPGKDIPNGFDLDNAIRIAILHHHPDIPKTVNQNIEQNLLKLMDADKVNALFNDLSIHLVLCGHQHFPFLIPPNNSNQHWISCAGSATQRDNSINSFKIYWIGQIRDKRVINIIEYNCRNKGANAKFRPIEVANIFV